MTEPQNIEQIYTAVQNGRLNNYWFWKEGVTSDAVGVPYLIWRAIGVPGAGSAPATNEAPTNSTTGSIPIPNPTGGRTSHFLKMELVSLGNTAGATGEILIDILSWTSGLSGTVTSSQTTNLPTTALTRYSGTASEGNRLALVCWTATGTTAANVTVTYTNSAGTGSRVTASTGFFTGVGSYGTTAPTANQVQLLPLAQDDIGIRSVESVLLSASTLTAGNWGVMIYRPLMVVTRGGQLIAARNMLTEIEGLTQKIDDACLSFIRFKDTTSGAYPISGYISVVEN